MYSKELISVIIPVYNVENYVGRCIDSVINQTYRNIEVIIVNDGSEDESLDIVRKYEKKDSRIKVFNKENGGLSSARNVGLDNAKGKYIVFVDSDDYMHPQMIEVLYANLIEKRADISVCDFYWIFDGDTVEEDITNHPVAYENNEVLYRMILDELRTVVAWNKLYKAEIFDKLRYPVGKLHEDEFIIHKILEQCKRCVYTDAKLYYYIKRAGSITASHSFKNVYDTEVAFCERLLWAIEKKDKRLADWCFNCVINEGNCIINQKELDDYEKKIVTVKQIIAETFYKIGISKYITWRKLIVGYAWLKNPRIGNELRHYLHC